MGDLELCKKGILMGGKCITFNLCFYKELANFILVHAEKYVI